jgi:hypothetical protein
MTALTDSIPPFVPKKYHHRHGNGHISLARDPYAVLAKVEEGVEVIVERNNRPSQPSRLPDVRAGPSLRALLRLDQRLEGDLGRRFRQRYECQGKADRTS